ncbi:MAG: copper-binding protein [Cyanobacteria bacterium RYN_339]|nr:copper-binding protein [Cyanobacteria bacterium RYN_339]
MRILKITTVLAAAAMAISCNSTTPTAGGSSTAPTASTAPGATTAPTAGAAAVTVSDFKFEPAATTIKAGDTVTWTFKGPTAHSATSDDSSTEKFDSTVMGAGKTFSYKFMNKGTFSYHCIPHPTNMKATITVQ